MCKSKFAVIFYLLSNIYTFVITEKIVSKSLSLSKHLVYNVNVELHTIIFSLSQLKEVINTPGSNTFILKARNTAFFLAHSRVTHWIFHY